MQGPRPIRGEGIMSDAEHLLFEIDEGVGIVTVGTHIDAVTIVIFVDQQIAIVVHAVADLRHTGTCR